MSMAKFSFQLEGVEKERISVRMSRRMYSNSV